MKKKIFVIDIDGVMTTGQFFYTQNGKVMKVFGPDDHDALKLLQHHLKISFITSDKRGYPISHKRIVKDMHLPLKLLDPSQKIEWMKTLFPLNQIIYMGDSFLDVPIFKQVGYAIAPNNAHHLAKKAADYVTKQNGGERAVTQACLYILRKFFRITNPI